MEFQKTKNLVGKSSKQFVNYTTRYQAKETDGATRRDNTNTCIKYKTFMLKSSLYDNS